MKQKNLQPRIFYPARLLFRFDGEIKSFSDKLKLRKFRTTQPALQKMLKNFSKQETQEKEKTYIKTIKNMVIGTYILIITLNVNGLTAPTKRHSLAEQMKTCECKVCMLIFLLISSILLELKHLLKLVKHQPPLF